VVDLDAALGEQLFDVAVGQAEAQVQRTAATITSGGKLKPAKAERAIGAGRGRRVLIGAVIATHWPGNPLGWIFLIIGLSEGLIIFGAEYAIYVFRTAPGAGPGGELAVAASPSTLIMASVSFSMIASFSAASKTPSISLTWIRGMVLPG
jgi:hypothetical protein